MLGIYPSTPEQKTWVRPYFLISAVFWKIVSATMLERASLDAVYIYFDTATYDEIERDEKVMLFYI